MSLMQLMRRPAATAVMTMPRSLKGDHRVYVEQGGRTGPQQQAGHDYATLQGDDQAYISTSNVDAAADDGRGDYERLS